MPIYDYECCNCNQRHEWYFTSWRMAPENLVCWDCGGEMERIISIPNFNTGKDGAPNWVREHAKMIDYYHEPGTKPLETRRDVDEFCKQKGFRKKESGFPNLVEA